MRRYTTSELEEFLRLVDSELLAPCSIVLIGGAAVGLGYLGEHATVALDLWEIRGHDFWGAVSRAQARTTKCVPVQKATIAEPPYDFEDRLRLLKLAGVNRLEVLIPEPHDLALMKTARAEAHDLDAIEDIHRQVGLELDTLIDRFHETKGQVMGSPSLFKIKFQAMIARLFGEDVAIEIEARLN